MTPEDVPAIEELLREVARREVMPRFHHIRATCKADGSLLTEADLAVHERLRTALADRYPAVGFLSEEMPADAQQARLDAGGPLWILDPLDGTSNFAAGIPFFGISLAYAEAGAVTAAFVLDPCRREFFHALAGGGAYCNHCRLAPPAAPAPFDQTLAMVDLKRLPPRLREALVAAPPYHSQRNFGACVLEWAWLAAGRGHLLLHGGQKLWDLAAGQLLLREAGGRCETLEGEEVFRPGLAPRSVVAALDGGHFERWRDWIRRRGREAREAG
ncbi:MAG: inositol monophosphatase family protein [Gammaproteobacteria bacterium]|nr:MAG: inositol monophosphatase family protein [Gammaproteobacteria bacterium]